MMTLPRKLAVAAAALAVLLCVFSLLPPGISGKAMADGENLLVNGTFEDNDGETPTDWEANCWDSEEGFTAFTVDPTGGSNGSAAACIENLELNDSRYMQEVSVTKGALYRLSGDIKVQGADGSWGATLSFQDNFTHTGPLFDTDGEFKHVELYARAAADQSRVVVFVRVGGYGSTCHGKAWFDNIVFEKVDGLPDGAVESSMATNSGGSSTDKDSQSNDYLPIIMMVAIAFAGVLLLCFRRMKGVPAIGEKGKIDWQFIGLAGVIALLLRMALALMVRGYPNDIDCWLGWSSQAATGGLFNMYLSPGFNDYPPGYMYVLWVVGQINRLFPASGFQVLMVKMPSIIADLATGYIIYRLALKRLGAREAVILSLLYVFNPLVLLDSSAWGQIDSILALLVVACFWQVYRGKMWPAAAIYGFGLLIKPQMLLFGPVLFGALIVAGRNAGGFGKGTIIWLKTIGALLAAFILPALPFWITQIANASAVVDVTEQAAALQNAYMWLPNIYIKASSTYTNATINACNLMALFGGNWVADTQKIFGLTYAFWGYLGMTLVSLFTLYVIIFRDKNNRRIFLWAALLISGLFVMGLRMHERYMFPAIALLLVYYILERDRRALYLFGLFSLTQFLNAAMVLANHDMSIDVIRNGDIIAIANPDGTGIWVLLISLTAATAFIYMVIASLKADTPLAGTSIDEEEVREHRLDRIRGDLAVTPAASSIPMQKKDWLILGAMTAAYAVLAFVYLGTTKVPQTFWHGANTDDYAVIDLGASKYVAEIEHYDSLTKGNLMISSSDDGIEWTDQFELVHKAVEADQKDDLGIYNWTTNAADFEARYVKLTVTAGPVRMLEFVMKDADGTVITPSGISDAGLREKTKREEALAGAAKLIDEQDRVPERSCFMNSMYFDEIYHARTGWEFTQGNITPYENTHPPLGKDLISLGILIFGMNPFGWRFMGTLMGVLMVPAMYLFGMAVFKKTRYAFIAAFLMTFDFMHFVQTRIATIDSYSVLFIILTFLCMYLYLNTNYNTQKLRRTFLPLALSGVFFGLASASKWIGLYAGAGLAIMFFYSIWRRWKEYDAVKFGDIEVDDETRAQVLSGFWKKTVLTVLWCGLFFVVVAGVIYFASYIPFNINSGQKLSAWDNFSYALKNQTSMYSYHSNLVDNHAFRSAWYQWPFLIKPMWFFKDGSLPAGWMGSIATFGNPAVWWVGTAAMVWLVFSIYKSRKFVLASVFILAGFLTEYLPWVLVPRTMFIYHYFASVPFFIIGIVMFIRKWEETPTPSNSNSMLQLIIVLGAALAVSFFMSLMLSAVLLVLLVVAIVMYRKRAEIDLYKKDMTHIYLAVALALFILFYPVLSGLPIPSWYGALTKWMPTWWFTY